MSYILDALKKASAEREQARGIAPGLATQPVRTQSGTSAEMGAALDQRNPLVLVLLAAVLLCAVTLVVLFWPRSETLPTTITTTIPAPLTAQQTTTSTAPPVVANTDQTSPLPTAASIGTPATPPQLARVTPAPSSLPPTTPAKPTAASPPPAKPDFPGVLPRPSPAPTPSTLAAQPSPSPIPMPMPMPQSVRAALGPLVISGSTYSDNPAFRMLILNGQVYREGEFPTPDLKLEQIKPKSAILTYQGNTYVLPY